MRRVPGRTDQGRRRGSWLRLANCARRPVVVGFDCPPARVVLSVDVILHGGLLPLGRSRSLHDAPVITQTSFSHYHTRFAQGGFPNLVLQGRRRLPSVNAESRTHSPCDDARASAAESGRSTVCVVVVELDFESSRATRRGLASADVSPVANEIHHQPGERRLDQRGLQRSALRLRGLRDQAVLDVVAPHPDLVGAAPHRRAR